MTQGKKYSPFSPIEISTLDNIRLPTWILSSLSYHRPPPSPTFIVCLIPDLVPLLLAQLLPLLRSLHVAQAWVCCLSVALALGAFGSRRRTPFLSRAQTDFPRPASSTSSRRRLRHRRRPKWCRRPRALHLLNRFRSPSRSASSHRLSSPLAFPLAISHPSLRMLVSCCLQPTDPVPLTLFSRAFSHPFVLLSIDVPIRTRIFGAFPRVIVVTYGKHDTTHSHINIVRAVSRRTASTRDTRRVSSLGSTF